MAFAVLRLCLFLAVHSSTLRAQAPTEQQLMQAFDRSCNDYVSSSAGISCEDAYNSLLSAFKGVPSLQPPPVNQLNYEGNYQAYFVNMKFTGPLGKPVLFWSRTQPLVKALVRNGTNVASSSGIDASEVIEQMSANDDIMKWCSDATSEIFINEMCTPSKNNASYVFWAEFSERLAEYADGTAFFLTNGTFRDTSFFAMYELPIILLPESSCSQLVVINVVSADSTELCGTNRLMTLKDMVSGEIEYKCFDAFGDPQNPSEELVSCVDQMIAGVQAGIDACDLC